MSSTTKPDRQRDRVRRQAGAALVMATTPATTETATVIT